MIRLAVFSACFFVALTNSAVGSPLVSSTFDSDAEGWTGITTDGFSSWSVISSGLTPTFSADGVPDGSIVLADPDSQWSYFSAPSIFLGDQSAAFGGSLQFDSRYVIAGSSYVNEADVVLKGAGLTLVYDITNSLPSTWTHFDVPLASGAWQLSAIFSGIPATDAQLLAVLSNLDSLWINAEHFTPVQESIALDNVNLFAPIPEPQTYAMLLAGLGLLVFAAYCEKNRSA